MKFRLVVTSEQGRLTPERIEEIVGDLTEVDVYLCGPGPLVRETRRGLRRLGVAGWRMHAEEFAFR